MPAGHPPGKPVEVWLNPEHGRWISALLDTGLVTPRWATSWHHDANALIAPRIGLPAFPHIELGRPNITTSHPDGYLWKRDPIARWLGTAPVAWIDDDFTDADHHWARCRGKETATMAEPLLPGSGG